ncbi:MAG: helix-turn-helix domain-containing protein [Rhodocyclaceae bacterium]
MPNPLHDPRYAVLRSLLVEERERNALTQVEIAARLGKPQSYVSKYERGERRLDMVECLDVARAIGIDPVTTLQKLIRKIG